MNIALFLPNWVGDVVMATPAIRAIRQLHPSARLIGVMKPYVADVLGGSGWLDAIIPADNFFSAVWQLRHERPDLAVLFPNSFRSALVAWLGGCQRRIGYARYARSFLLTDALPVAFGPDGRPLVSPILDAYNALAEAAGCPPPGHRLELFTTRADEQAADRVWEIAGFTNPTEVICLNPGAAFGAAKHWPSEHFSRLADDLIEKRGCSVLVLCGPSEREMASWIAANASLPSVFALSDIEQRGGPKPSIGLTKALVRRCSLLITTDSGPRHFAHAFNRPVVTLFGPTHIGWTETYHPLAVHLQKKLDCGPCQKRVCPLGHHMCMTTLAPDEVLAAALPLSNKASGGREPTGGKADGKAVTWR
jgi:heptosyltransferase-2